ncbi:hypothetical protein [uncultured Marivirga sp.]|uniref:hypothetical protein n=1 Tax=uncultured Marivirga sp. TaxID=1123707 RepID=UPI0030EDDCAB|tara:strand:- start:576706 stop:577104 length:399 start_codon:yes stop_codon:yes gene_type:complete
MNTKIVMISSCIFLGALGITFTFIPDEIISGLSATPNPISILSLQLLGALYLGFTMLNWMAKGSLIGGIYNRPIAIGNFMHFAVGALALIKIITKIHTHSEIVISLTVAYSVFAILFGYVLITNPSRIEKKA